MTEPLVRPKRKNPLKRTRLPLAPQRVRSRTAHGLTAAAAEGRFALQVYHALPYQPIHGGRLEVLFALRTLYRDLSQPGSLYDEFLTLSPPLRLVGGMRVCF